MIHNTEDYLLVPLKDGGYAKISPGLFDSEEGAARAYDKAAIQIGRTKHLNFSDQGEHGDR